MTRAFSSARQTSSSKWAQVWLLRGDTHSWKNGRLLSLAATSARHDRITGYTNGLHTWCGCGDQGVGGRESRFASQWLLDWTSHTCVCP